MYRFRIVIPNSDRIRYGTPLVEALTTNLEPQTAYFISGNDILKVNVSLYRVTSKL